MNEKIFNAMTISLQKSINDDIAYMYGAFIPPGTTDVLLKMKSDIDASDRDLLDIHLQKQVENRLIFPYDLLMDKVSTHISDFYRELSLSAQTQNRLAQYGTRADLFKSQFKAALESSKNTSIKVIQRELELQMMQNRDAKDVMRYMSVVIQKRIQALNQHLESLAGQMEQYMVLWDYQDAGFTHYRFKTKGKTCDNCSGLDGKTFPISEAECGKNLAPLHPNCDCQAEIIDEKATSFLSQGHSRRKQKRKKQTLWTICKPLFARFFWETIQKTQIFWVHWGRL